MNSPAFDPFERLGIAPAFNVDVTRLESQHRELSRALHPDRHAGKGATERRHALGLAIEVNDAFRLLKDPVRRAELLLRRLGVAAGERVEPAPDQALLFEIMEQREALADAKASGDLNAVLALGRHAEQRERQLLAQLGALLDGALLNRAIAASVSDAAAPAFPSFDSAEALRTLGELRYVRRLRDEVAAIEDDLS